MKFLLILGWLVATLILFGVALVIMIAMNGNKGDIVADEEGE